MLRPSCLRLFARHLPVISTSGKIAPTAPSISSASLLRPLSPPLTPRPCPPSCPSQPALPSTTHLAFIPCLPSSPSAARPSSHPSQPPLPYASARAFSSMGQPTEISSTKMFGGFNKRYEHDSAVLGCSMKFTVYFPPAAVSNAVPVVYWLSGLTCTDENFIQKSFAQKYAADYGLALVAPDTSPRGLNVEGEADSWDFGVGAGFYLNATVPKWKNWQMYDYITNELHRIIASRFDHLDSERCSIMGHSMGGHGALTIYLKNPGKYKAVSAFAPICNPTKCPWGIKAFTGFLGEDQKDWESYDATLLVKEYPGPKREILIDQGDKDKFYIEKQLLPESFQEACKEGDLPLTLRFQGGYDHSYFFIASFIEDHIEHHAKALKE